MREIITRWLTDMVLFSMMTTFLMRILPGKTYTPYIRLFTGFILILLFLNPLLSVMNLSDSLAVEVNKELFLLETEEMESQLIEMEENQKKQYEKAYKEEMENQILLKGREKGYPLLRVDCELKEGQVEEITLVYEKKASSGSKKDMKNYIRDFYNVESDNIYIKVENPDEG